MAFPLPCEELWHSALVNYGLERPSKNTEIHVFRVILQTSLDKTACTRSVVSAGPMSDPFKLQSKLLKHGGTWRSKRKITHRSQLQSMVPVRGLPTKTC